MTRLGRGLDALLQSLPETTDKATGITTVGVEHIVPNRYQPRKVFDEDKLRELAESIQQNGLIQPVIVTKRDDTDKYELVAGERRLQAAKLAGLDKIPVIIRSISKREQLQLAIIENVQREDLNPIEEAMAYQQLVNDFGFTHAKIAELVGKDRATITNFLRLLKLQKVVQQLMLAEKLSPGHARAILQVKAELQEEFANYIVDNKLSVRKAEAKAKKIKKTGAVQTPLTLNSESEEKHLNAEKESMLERMFNVKVKISDSAKKGKISFYYNSENELDRLLKSFEKRW
ncbi:MAG: ParB family transcriptional regulator, chromosome partitioning protein [Candidatus Cloacimonadota bacterium]|jgi:ParB family chromosome partitioning protein|nr:ParB family transcriptional regulator, chromosome partitioning protein [Candidatus Cloacimonadota bacterium]